MERRPILILGPMDSESADLISALDDRCQHHIGAYRYHVGSIDGYPVIVCKCGIGVVNSAVAAALAIQRFDPLCVLLQGTSGAHDPALHQGDVVLGERLIHIGRFFTPHRGAGAGSNPFSWEYHGSEVSAVHPTAEVSELHSDPSILALARALPYTHGRVVTGAIGAADIWNRELDMIAHLHATLGTDCEEMEGFGVAQVCAQLNVPMADIRVISNSELYPDEEFDETTGAYCQEFILALVRSLIQHGGNYGKLQD